MKEKKIGGYARTDLHPRRNKETNTSKVKEEIKEAADKMVESMVNDSYYNATQSAIKCCQHIMKELNNALYVENESNPTTEYLQRRLSHYQDIKDYLQTL